MARVTASAVVFAALWSSFLWVVSTRHWQHPGIYPLYIALGIGPVLMTALGVYWRKIGLPDIIAALPILIIGAVSISIPLTLLATAAIGISDFVTYVDLIGYFKAAEPDRIYYLKLVGIALCTLTLGGVLFYFRLKQRLLYGITEAGVGMIVSASYATKAVRGIELWSPQMFLTLLTAGVYLVVRGLDNMHTAIKNGDPIVTMLKSRNSPPSSKSDSDLGL